MHLLPIELRVLGLLRERAPQVSWPGRRVVWCVRDYKDVIDVESVAARLVDAIAERIADRLRQCQPVRGRFRAVACCTCHRFHHASTSRHSPLTWEFRPEAFLEQDRNVHTKKPAPDKMSGTGYL